MPCGGMRERCLFLVIETSKGRGREKGEGELPSAGESTELRRMLSQAPRGELQRQEPNPLSDAEIANTVPSVARVQSHDAGSVETDLGALRAGATANPENDWRLLTVTEATEFSAARIGDAEEGGATTLEQCDHGDAERGGEGLRQSTENQRATRTKEKGRTEGNVLVFFFFWKLDVKGVDQNQVTPEEVTSGERCGWERRVQVSQEVNVRIDVNQERRSA